MTKENDGFHRTALDVAKENGDHSGKVFLVTGAYSGIGIETTKALLAVKGKVVVAGRNAKQQEQFVETLKKDFDSELIDGEKTLDLGDLKSVKEFSDNINAKYDKIDCLINNAGVMCTPKGTTKDGFEVQVGVNVVGHFLLSKLLAPKTARQVWLSSSAHTMKGSPRFDFDAFKNFNMDVPSYDPWLWYQQSKLGNILIAKEFARRHEMEAVSVHPGAINTNLGRHMGFFTIASLLAMVVFKGIKFKNVEQGAATSILCATLKADDSRYVNGAYYQDCGVADETKSAKNMDDAKALYDYCDEVTKEFQ